jgi:hypothetical protein
MHKTTKEKLAAKLAKIKCFNCGEKGHIAKGCPDKLPENEEAEVPPMAGMILDRCCTL